VQQKGYLAAIIATLGFLGTMITLLINNIYSDLINVHNIVVEITPAVDGDSCKGLIEVRNSGKAPVTNLSLIIKSSEEMTYSNFSSVSGVTFKPLSTTILRADVPKFIHGDGSVILVNTTIKGNQGVCDSSYSAYATYDQGSVKGNFRSSSIDPRGTMIGMSIAIGLVITLAFTAVIMAYELLNILWRSNRQNKIRQNIK
jgi:hypothetical protein